MNYARRYYDRLDRHKRIMERETARDMLKVCNEEVLDSRCIKGTVLEPGVVAKGLECELDFTRKNIKQTATPTGESKLADIKTEPIEVGEVSGK